MAPNTAGVEGEFDVLSITFDAIGDGGSSSDLDLEYTAMSAAGTFGDLLSSLTVTDGTVSITGSAPQPDIAVDPASNNYGVVTVGNSGSQTFTVTNEGDADLNVSATDLTGADAGEFSIDSGGGAFTLAPNASQDIVVSFSPASSGAKSATLFNQQ